MPPATLALTPRGPFDLAQSAAFLEDFTPSQAVVADGRVALGLADDAGRALAAVVRQEADGTVTGTCSDPDAGDHVARILGLDVDARGLADVGTRDPVVAGLLERFPGRRPVLFGTPFAAAVWAVLSQRTSQRQAMRVQAALTEQLGSVVAVDGVTVPIPPGPDVLAAAGALPGVPMVKAERVRALARAALDGVLDAGRLRAKEQDEAVAHLCALPGIGPFSAALVLIRGAGHPDVLLTPLAPLRRAVASAYGLTEDEVDEAALERLGAAWRPYRAWVLFLLRNALDS